MAVFIWRTFHNLNHIAKIISLKLSRKIITHNVISSIVLALKFLEGCWEIIRVCSVNQVNRQIGGYDQITISMVLIFLRFKKVFCWFAIIYKEMDASLYGSEMRWKSKTIPDFDQPRA